MGGGGTLSVLPSVTTPATHQAANCHYPPFPPKSMKS